MVAGFATDLIGLDRHDPDAAQWVIRVVLSLLFWPIGDSNAERLFVERFVGPALHNRSVMVFKPAS